MIGGPKAPIDRGSVQIQPAEAPIGIARRKKRKMNKKYAELLKDPRWQKKRLEIFQRENFECEWCGSKDNPLTVHHDYYRYGKTPWEYPDTSLHCLCEECHGIVTKWKKEIKKHTEELLIDNLTQLLGYIVGLKLSNYPDESFDVYDYEMAQGVGDCFQMTADQVLYAKHLNKGQIDGWMLVYVRKQPKARRKNGKSAS